MAFCRPSGNLLLAFQDDVIVLMLIIACKIYKQFHIKKKIFLSIKRRNNLMATYNYSILIYAWFQFLQFSEQQKKDTQQENKCYPLLQVSCFHICKYDRHYYHLLTKNLGPRKVGLQTKLPEFDYVSIGEIRVKK